MVGGGGEAFNIRGKGLLGELGGLSRGFFFFGGGVLSGQWCYKGYCKGFGLKVWCT